MATLLCTCRGDDILLDEVQTSVMHMLQPPVQLSMGQFVGLEPQLQQIRAALGMGSAMPGHGVQLHGLYGLGGVGKTTLAQQFYEEATGWNSPFAQHAFLHVGQDALPGSALALKQRDLLQQLGGYAAENCSDAELREALHRSFKSGGPLLLVVDDLWIERQLAVLLGCEPNSTFQLPAGLWAPGSRILITARYRALVSDQSIRATQPQAEPQQVQPLPELAAQQLLRLHAFDKGVQPASFTEQHMAAATAICGGLPLTLRLLGGALSQRKTAAGWQVIAGNARCCLWSLHLGMQQSGAILQHHLGRFRPTQERLIVDDFLAGCAGRVGFGSRPCR